MFLTAAAAITLTIAEGSVMEGSLTHMLYPFEEAISRHTGIKTITAAQIVTKLPKNFSIFLLWFLTARLNRIIKNITTYGISKKIWFCAKVGI